MTAITGNTYPVKEQIKALGGRWNADQKAWMVPDDKADEARALVSQAPKSTGRRNYGKSRYGSNYTRFNSGAEVYTNKNGRCEDAPCCGCCS
jgi:hypothetical protein